MPINTKLIRTSNVFRFTKQTKLLSMPIFSSLNSFLRRHKKKLIVTATLTFSAYFLVNQFIIKKLKNFQNSLRQELFVKEQIKRRFVQTQNDCYLTILALLPVLTQPIINHLPIELITQALKLKKTNSNPTPQEISDSLLTTDNLTMHQNTNDSSDLSHYMSLSKTELWKLLKIKTLTRTLTLMYSISGLLLLTRLQLNILARRSYLESAIILAGGKVNDTETSQDYFIEQSYLSLSWWLLNKGWLKISDLVEKVVTEKFNTINARTELSINKFDDLLCEMVNELSTNHNQEILNAIFPISYDNLIESLLNTNSELIKELDIEDSIMLKLINETTYLVSNEAFGDILINMVDSCKSTLIENLLLSLDPENAYTNQEKVIDISNIKQFKLANLLAQLSIQCGVLCDNNNLMNDTFSNELSGNIYMNNLNEIESLDEFSASIYSNFE